MNFACSSKILLKLFEKKTGGKSHTEKYLNESQILPCSELCKCICQHQNSWPPQYWELSDGGTVKEWLSPSPELLCQVTPCTRCSWAVVTHVLYMACPLLHPPAPGTLHWQCQACSDCYHSSLSQSHCQPTVVFINSIIIPCNNSQCCCSNTIAADKIIMVIVRT